MPASLQNHLFEYQFSGSIVWRWEIEFVFQVLFEEFYDILFVDLLLVRNVEVSNYHDLVFKFEKLGVAYQIFFHCLGVFVTFFGVNLVYLVHVYNSRLIFHCTLKRHIHYLPYSIFILFKQELRRQIENKCPTMLSNCSDHKSLPRSWRSIKEKHVFLSF